MAEITLKDGTPVHVSKSVDQPALVYPWEDAVRYRIAFNGELIGFVESWRVAAGPRHPKRWIDSFSLGVLQRAGRLLTWDVDRYRYHKTRNAALERLVSRFTATVKKGK